jgi:hypothetical protein
VLATLIAIILCTTYDLIIDYLASTLVTLVAMSTLAATSETKVKMTIVITNLYRAQLSFFFGSNVGFLSLLGDL